MKLLRDEIMLESIFPDICRTDCMEEYEDCSKCPIFQKYKVLALKAANFTQSETLKAVGEWIKSTGCAWYKNDSQSECSYYEVTEKQIQSLLKGELPEGMK